MFREPLATAKTTVGGVEVPRTEILGYAVGGRTSGFDLVRRHAYEVGAQVFTSGGRGEGDVSYEYRGLGNPTIGVTASQTWDDDGVRVRRPGNGSGGLARDLLRPGTGAAAGHVGARAPARRAYVDVTEVLGRAGPERPGSAG